jgi:hypothetical protein
MKVQTYIKECNIIDITPKSWGWLKSAILNGKHRLEWFYKKDKVIDLNLDHIDYLYHLDKFYEKDSGVFYEEIIYDYFERGLIKIGEEEIVVDIPTYTKILRYTNKCFDRCLNEGFKKKI